MRSLVYSGMFITNKINMGTQKSCCFIFFSLVLHDSTTKDPLDNGKRKCLLPINRNILNVPHGLWQNVLALRQRSKSHHLISLNINKYGIQIAVLLSMIRKGNQLAHFMMRLVSLPHSSAAVKRIFSKLYLLKTKARNNLTTATLSGLLQA